MFFMVNFYISENKKKIYLFIYLFINYYYFVVIDNMMFYKKWGK
jgi:hypothetical protein